MHYYTVYMLQTHRVNYQAGSERASSHIRGKQLFSKGCLTRLYLCFLFFCLNMALSSERAI